MLTKLSLMVGLSSLAIAGVSSKALADTAPPRLVNPEVFGTCGAVIDADNPAPTYTCRDGSSIDVTVGQNGLTAVRQQPAPFVAPQSGTQTAAYQPAPTSVAGRPIKPPAPPGMEEDRFKCVFNPAWKSFQRCSVDTYWKGTQWDFRPDAQYIYFDLSGKFISAHGPKLVDGRLVFDNGTTADVPTSAGGSPTSNQQVASSVPNGSVRGMMQGKPTVEALNIHGPDGDYHAVSVAQPSAGERLLDAGIGVGLLFALGEASHRARCYNHC